MSIKKCLIISEAGSCHEGNRVKAQELIMEAKMAGASFIKFQLFPKDMFPHNIALPYELWPELVKYANDIGIGIFASVFDKEALKLVAKTSFYIKIAYSQRHNYGLIGDIKYKIRNMYTGKYGKRIIISGDDYTDFPEHTTKLLCVPKYPADPKDYDIQNFDPEFYDGISDHTKGWELAVQAVRRGAKFIEKHIKFEQTNYDIPDSYLGHSLKPSEFKEMVRRIKAL